MINLTTFKPQLVGEGNIDYFLFNNEAIFIEPKIDGCRILCEKKGNELKFYTRNNKDWTHKFVELSKKLLPLINATNCIMDGEIAVLKEGKVLTSTDILRKKLRKGEQYCYFVFDILQIGEESMLEESLLCRKQHLGLLVEESKYLQLIPCQPTNSIADVKEVFQKCVAKGFEGIVLKNCKGYTPDSRWNWLKLKPFLTRDVQITDKKRTKDNKAWVYTYLTEKNKKGSIMSNQHFEIGAIIELAYSKGNYDSLRFPRVVRVRVDK